MRRHPLPVAAAVFVAALIVTAGPAAAVSGLDRPAQWREVFSPDGSITRVPLPQETEAPLSARDFAAAAAAEVVTVQNTGPSSARFDMVIIGDGYTASEMDTLRSHAEAKWNEIAATSPWSGYLDSINVWLVNVISNESGVDNDPYRGISRDTALGMYFWCGGIERLLCLSETRAQQYAAQAPGADAIVALANSTKYGGAGYPSLATVSGGNSQAGRIAIHELGHSVGGLADEYYTPGTTYRGSEPREPNVTTSSGCSKWAAYLGRATPDGGTIGCYQGGHQYAYGIFRPSQDSLMRNINQPFNLVGLDVMDRAIASKIDDGGGGDCTGYDNTRTGSLSSGGTAYQPDGSYFYSSTSGQHGACLDGPTGFDLALLKWNGSAWATVASGSTTLTYSGTSGYYTYRIRAVSGSGSYTLGYDTP